MMAPPGDCIWTARLEATLVVNATPRSDTTQRAGLGTMIESDGTTNGHFQGVLDEAQVWNARVARLKFALILITD